MEARSKGVRAALASPNIEPREPAELDYSPKKMTPRETLIVSLKLAAVAAAFLGLLWLAHVKLEK
ncbi:MAG: hypothetical protein P4K98_07235 [Bryobacteraceae bacterium]|nr:hypothetical protein [Bryobacteraceae bacterium]